MYTFAKKIMKNYILIKPDKRKSYKIKKFSLRKLFLSEKWKKYTEKIKSYIFFFD